MTVVKPWPSMVAATLTYPSPWGWRLWRMAKALLVRRTSAPSHGQLADRRDRQFMTLCAALCNMPSGGQDHDRPEVGKERTAFVSSRRFCDRGDHACGARAAMKVEWFSAKTCCPRLFEL